MNFDRWNKFGRTEITLFIQLNLLKEAPAASYGVSNLLHFYSMLPVHKSGPLSEKQK